MATYPDFVGLQSNRSYPLLVNTKVFMGAGFYTTTGYTILSVENSVGVAVATAGFVLALLQVFSSIRKVLAGWFADVLPSEPHTRIGAILFVQTFVGGLLFFVVNAV